MTTTESDLFTRSFPTRILKDQFSVNSLSSLCFTVRAPGDERYAARNMLSCQ